MWFNSHFSRTFFTVFYLHFFQVYNVQYLDNDWIADLQLPAIITLVTYNFMKKKKLWFHSFGDSFCLLFSNSSLSVHMLVWFNGLMSVYSVRTFIPRDIRCYGILWANKIPVQKLSSYFDTENHIYKIADMMVEY